MDISFNSDCAVFVCDFDRDHHFLQVFRGMSDAQPLTSNGPVDFRMAGIKRKTTRDIWHPETVFSWATDEVPPFMLSGYMAGGNHSIEACVKATIQGHGRTLADVGTLWTDDAGRTWTLLRVDNPYTLTLLSSDGLLKFATEITGKLHRGNIVLTIDKQRGKVPFVRTIRHTERAVYIPSDDGWTRIYDDADNADKAQIRETYEIVDPGDSARLLAEHRPEGGYKTEPDLALGQALAWVTNIYEIQNDGTVIVDVEEKPRADLSVDWVMGLMYQEKCDLGGGNIRIIPGLKPFDGYDFSHGVNTSVGPFPDEERYLEPELFANPANPPICQYDIMRDSAGHVKTVFAAGFLPVLDAEPSLRAGRIGEAYTLAPTRKTYPTVLGSFLGRNVKGLPAGQAAHFIGYRRYLPGNDEGKYNFNVYYENYRFSFEETFEKTN